ncbi:p-cresol methylhydroxylase [Pseudomonas jessenii]|jgi:mono/diheme cytochrome c family protein|uniref:Cytochrome C oxidase, cbb3-type, subunit III n=2 Tax=Pseudomonas TaxID=286 RepID=A0A231GP92_PSEJE|nr:MULTISPECIES: cytochrome c [Pseudomonas]OXR38437.1 p-cresol methylhydroxylase [Pseudomonas jessenii]WLH10844.1 cytochrome c [Pseudomonas sp. FP205]WLH93926.1 cytochrome c [Pseudomonas sp. FP53]WLI38200.1 cytochrome c [Pseudomonas sp. FP821]SEC08605.1 Cytochrome C oxidase, cbb3-type, subunit III [Pseudomonas jessenii]
MKTNRLIVLMMLAGLAVASEPAKQAVPAHRGKQIFDQWCGICHAASPRMPGTASLAAKYGGSLPAALEERTDMPPAFIEHFVRKGVLIMPAFRKTEITDADLELLVDYLKAKDQ